jgi:spermidine synthase
MKTAAPRQPEFRSLATAFLVAAALILLQVSFSRLISYKLFYHFVFLAIALTLLGLGAAGTFVAVTRPPQDVDRSIRRWLVALTVSVPIGFLLLANPIIFLYWPLMRSKLLGADATVYLAWCAPVMVWANFCGGVVLTRLFSAYSQRMGLVYAFDLLGAGAGSLGAIGIMKYGSPPAAFVAAGALAALAALVHPTPRIASRRVRLASVIGAAVYVALAAGVFLGPPIYRNFENFHLARPHRSVIKYEWNHLIRTDHMPGWYVLDGEAATDIVEWTPQEAARRMSAPEYVLGPPEPAVAIIGVGGGRQLAEALRARAKSVLAVDINPTILAWVSGVDRDLTGSLFQDPRIEIRLGEGRHTVRSAGRAFDAIVIHAIDTYAASAAGAYALTENFLYTKEAFQDYFRVLSDAGVLSISRWLFYPPRENMRLFVTALAALEELGIEHPEQHLAVVAPVPDYERLGDRRVWGFVLVAKRPLGEEQLAKLRAHVQSRNWSILYAPDMSRGTYFDQYAQSSDREAFRRSYPYLISPVTDASPYLFQFYDPLRWASFDPSRDWATVHIYQWSAITLLITLGGSLVLSLLLIVAPLVWTRRWRSGNVATRFGLRHGLYFAGLGVGFMALEVPLIQILSLYLGHPTYGFAVVLVALLVASGMGSLLADRTRLRPSRAAALVALLLAVVTAGVFALVRGTLDLSDPLRFTIALALTFALGVPMGFPLALGVRHLGRSDERGVAWAWAVNGTASVVGSCVVMIAMVFAGSQAALTAGVASYVISALAASSWRDES